MALAKSQRSLKAWGKQKWRTKSVRSLRKLRTVFTRENTKALSSAEYAATTRAKRRGTKRAKLICEATERIAKKISNRGIANAVTLWKNEKKKSNKNATEIEKLDMDKDGKT